MGALEPNSRKEQMSKEMGVGVKAVVQNGANE
jgi:hypothetical protein